MGSGDMQKYLTIDLVRALQVVDVINLTAGSVMVTAKLEEVGDRTVLTQLKDVVRADVTLSYMLGNHSDSVDKLVKSIYEFKYTLRKLDKQATIGINIVVPKEVKA